MCSSPSIPRRHPESQVSLKMLNVTVMYYSCLLQWRSETRGTCMVIYLSLLCIPAAIKLQHLHRLCIPSLDTVMHVVLSLLNDPELCGCPGRGWAGGQGSSVFLSSRGRKKRQAAASEWWPQHTRSLGEPITRQRCTGSKGAPRIRLAMYREEGKAGRRG